MFTSPLSAKEELVTLPERESVQLTIYNSEDLTLVRERRKLTFKEGENRIQFSWANTLIDPTSVEFEAVGDDARKALEVQDTSYPGESHEMLIWTISCSKPAGYTVQISYFTSGISWSAEYTGIVDAAESSMDLTGFVTVHNRSGEEYENAQVRLVVGVIHLVERIIDLAQPGLGGGRGWSRKDMETMDEPVPNAEADPSDDANGMRRPKEIQKAGLSEYYIYTVGGTETIPNQWSKRLRSFEVKGVPLQTVYRLEPDKFGPYFTKVLEFKNDEEHKLGKEPLPDGILRLYKNAGNGGLGFMGVLASKYIPKNEEVKVNVGPDAECTMAEKRLSLKKKDLAFRNNYLVGWTTVEAYETELKNFRGRDVEIEIHRTMRGDFDFTSEDAWEKHDADTQKIRFTLKSNSSRKLAFTVTTRQGTNSRK